jgi:hypothetical protein
VLLSCADDAQAAVKLYETKDIYSQPATSIFIRLDGCDDAMADASLLDGTCFVIAESDLEATVGSQQRFTKAQHLTVCFNHSFGKCGGRAGLGPESCQQLHIRRSKLDALRRQYLHPRRAFLSRTVKAVIPQDLKTWLLNATRGKSRQMQYFEFATTDVEKTNGLMIFEGAFRAWLTAADAPASLVPFRCEEVRVCSEWAFTRQCLRGTSCPHIHTEPRCAMTRDPVIARALEYLTCFPSNPVALQRRGPQPAFFSGAEAKPHRGAVCAALPAESCARKPKLQLDGSLVLGGAAAASAEDLSDATRGKLADILRRVLDSDDADEHRS